MAALATVQDPEIHKDLVTLGMVRDVVIEGTEVSLTVVLTTPACPLKATIQKDVESALLGLESVETVRLAWDAKPRVNLEQQAIPGVGAVVAIGSGKGGVGKSTVTVNLALALAASGARVGVLDADIYGPSIPLMLGLEQARPMGQGQTILPIEAMGLKVMSMGFMLDKADDPVIWRGPILAGVLRQFLQQVAWGELDYLLVDLPPGTGDIPLTLVQTIPLSGAVVVVTPERVATAIGTKTMRMFQGQNTKAPILGIIENMGAFTCPHCQEPTEIFDGGGGEALAGREGVPFLGSLPLDARIRRGSDAGKPIVAEDPQSELARRFSEIAGRLAGQVSVEAYRSRRVEVALPMA
ncbi:MAG: Mrp/NBP35 family ATP-binding protein [Candidatus Sericytochromatia bacterium]|nr:Mrp/NBP35 family ATP-binding protein [Candidatus Sericytochromatia bacterium]